MPVGVIPIGIGVDNGRIAPADSGSVRVINPTTRMISPIGAPNRRAASTVHGRAVAGLNCRATLVMGDIGVFPLIGISVKSGTR